MAALFNRVLEVLQQWFTADEAEPSVNITASDALIAAMNRQAVFRAARD